jgi:hypothetical protein
MALLDRHANSMSLGHSLGMDGSQRASEATIASLPTRTVHASSCFTRGGLGGKGNEENADVGAASEVDPNAAIDPGSPGPDSNAAAAAAAAASSPGCVESCPICMEPLAPGDVAKSLPCLHAFHAKCIDQWLRTSRRCPMCNHCVGE